MEATTSLLRRDPSVDSTKDWVEETKGRWEASRSFGGESSCVSVMFSYMQNLVESMEVIARTDFAGAFLETCADSSGFVDF